MSINLDQFTEMGYVGQGQYGVVFSAKDETSGEWFAIKMTEIFSGDKISEELATILEQKIEDERLVKIYSFGKIQTPSNIYWNHLLKKKYRKGPPANLFVITEELFMGMDYF